MVDLTDCDREPIHIPGTIQPYGVLLVLAEPALTITQVSENVGDHLPLGVEEVLGQPLSTIIDPASVDRGAGGAARGALARDEPVAASARTGSNSTGSSTATRARRFSSSSRIRSPPIDRCTTRSGRR